ncbi:MAG: DoxX family protein [Gemmataceae bacterium]
MRNLTTYLFGLFFVAAGINHFVRAEFYVRIMPPYLPWHLELVYASGVAEIILGAALWVPRCRRLAAWGLVALLIAVFPANVHMALNAEQFPSFPPVVLWLRLPLQGVFIAWACAIARPKST